MSTDTGAPRSLPEGTVSLLFTDVEGSTDLRTREGDDVAESFLLTHERILREVATAEGGQEVVFLGDGFLFAFVSTRKALACAVAIQRALEEHNAGHPEMPIRVRIGINTGEVTQQRGTLYGTAVNAAARIMGEAAGGQILVSQLVKDLTFGVREFRFEDRGLHRLKGFPEDWRLYEVPWRASQDRPDETAGRPLPPAAVAPLRSEAPAPSFRLIGRDAEREAIRGELERAKSGRIRVVSLEGEAGIGKTRLMEEMARTAREQGFGVASVGGDEELRGPFLLLRTLLASTEVETLASDSGASQELEAARSELAGGRSGEQEGLTASEQMLRVYDLVTVALRRISTRRPLVLLLDDLQWADEDSIKLIRYLVRTSQTMPLLLVLSIRWEVEPTATAASALVADLERMNLAHRIRLGRFSRPETAELLEQVLGAPVGPDAAGTLHGRGEGVPFFIVEFARAYREARLLQLVKGRWEISRSPRQTVPTSVQVLIERRLAQLPERTRAALGDAAVVGRRVRFEELAAVCSRVGDDDADPASIADLLEPAVAHSLLAPAGDGADLVFTHDQIRAALLRLQPKERGRQIHAALVQLVAGRAGLDLDDDRLDAPASVLSTLAQHALAAGDPALGVRASIAAARAAVDAHAPEEAVRLVEAARTAASEPGDRAELLRLRDDALTILGRAGDRLAVLAELAALVSALGDPAVATDVTLRRASAARQTGDREQALELAAQARTAASDAGDRATELRATLEEGQSALGASLGEAFIPESSEADLDRGQEAFTRAAELAAELGDETSLAIAKRELGVIQNGRAHARLSVLVGEGREMEGFQDPEILAAFEAAKELIGEAVEICERTGDRRCQMSSLIALAYSHVIDDTQHGHAGRIEQIRRLMQRLSRLTSETERADGELHMLYSIELYAVTHGYPDLAIARGLETYGAARARGAHRFAFLAAGGLIEAHLQLGQTAEAEDWLGRAEEEALDAPSPLSVRQLEEWRALLRGAQGDAAAMIDHFEEAARLAVEQGSIAGRCQAHATLSIHAAHMAAGEGDPLLGTAEEAAAEALRMAENLPGSDPWAARAHAALALVAHHRDDAATATEEARAALAAEHAGRHLYKIVDVKLWLAVALALEGQDDAQAQAFRGEVGFLLAIAAASIADDSVRASWLGLAPVARLVELVGGLPDVRAMMGGDGRPQLSPEETQVLRRFTGGERASEIASAMSLAAEQVEEILGRVFDRLGARSDTEAAERAVRAGIS